jgi:beta-lactam-binding protein with PASTA domain
MPIVDIDRNAGPAAGSVLRQTPEAGTLTRPGDLVRIVVALAAVGGERTTTLPVATGAELSRMEQLFARLGVSVEVVELNVPGHPYAGTGRVAAQYPVSTVSSSVGRVVTLWLVR